MSETRDAFGPLLTRLQADMTALRADMRGLRSEQIALRDYLVGFINARAAETEAMIEEKIGTHSATVERLFAHLDKRLDQSERSLDERLTRIEAKLSPLSP